MDGTIGHPMTSSCVSNHPVSVTFTCSTTVNVEIFAQSIFSRISGMTLDA